jgi:adenylosuccinate synthase
MANISPVSIAAGNRAMMAADLNKLNELRLDDRRKRLAPVAHLKLTGNDEQMVTWVGDLQQGDGGKGAMSDRLARYHHVVVRTQGGDNAGHTTCFVDRQNKMFELKTHVVPSGVRHRDVVGIIANGVMLNPEQLVAEIAQLTPFDSAVARRVYISDRAHIVFPFHRQIDILQEDMKQKQCKEIGTTKRGIGPANLSKVGRIGIRVYDLANLESVADRIKDNIDFFNLPSNYIQDSLNWIMKYREFLLERALDSTKFLNAALDEGYSIVFEGAQGPLIDLEHGIYPYVTTCPTAFYSVGLGTGIDGGRVKNKVGVLKVYQTMVGNGRFVTEDPGELGNQLRSLGNEFGTTTSRPRRCGWLDLVCCKWAVDLNGYTSVILTKLDILDTLPEIGVCVAYENNGKYIIDFRPEQEYLVNCRPVYKFFKGWQRSTESIAAFVDLPMETKVFIEYIAQYLNIDIGGVTKGPKDCDLLENPASKFGGLLLQKRYEAEGKRHEGRGVRRKA